MAAVRQAIEPSLRGAILHRLDALLGALNVQPADEEGRFRVDPQPPGSFSRVYGGQLLAQALIAAGGTVNAKLPLSLHAGFLRAGTPGRALEIDVNRVRDGRSMATRHVTLIEHGKPLLDAIVGFHNGPAEPATSPPAPPSPQPDDLPPLQQWVRELPADLRHHGQHWIDEPPAVEIRLGQPPSFLGGNLDGPTRSHWMRVPRQVGDDALLHAALLAYASDFFLMDMVFHDHPYADGPGRSNGWSLDHAIWFHRPVRFDEWHLYTQEAVAVVGDRGLARGTIHDFQRRLVATVMQEVLVLPAETP